MNEKPEFKKHKLSSLESILIGGLTGALEVSINLPLWTIKMRSQCDLPFTLKPSILYRGYSVGFISMTTLTSVQLLSCSAYENTYDGVTVTSRERLVSSFLGGAASAIIFGPINLVGTQYHKYNFSSYFETASLTYKNLGSRAFFHWHANQRINRRDFYFIILWSLSFR